MKEKTTSTWFLRTNVCYWIKGIKVSSISKRIRMGIRTKNLQLKYKEDY
jgi:hypothetical protein